MSKQKRLKERLELLDMWNEIEPARNEEIARRAIDKAQEYLAIAERQADHITALENRESWTPIDEALPELYKDVLCQCRADIFMVLQRVDDGRWVQSAHEKYYIYMKNFVVAWRELPKPYKGGQDGTT